jgi:succinate dehydrogenase/fumarate reductase flavoprotein subunit
MVQVHPTGFTDVPKGFSDSPDRSLILCAEILRGAGAVLIERNGGRFVDELQTRKFVTEAMNEMGQGTYAIVVPPHAAEATATHMDIYTGKGLLHEVEGMEGVKDFIKGRLNGGREPSSMEETFSAPISETSAVPRSTPTKLPISGTYRVGVVQPVLHYTMGGLTVDGDGRVMDVNGTAMEGMFAGEKPPKFKRARGGTKKLERTSEEIPLLTTLALVYRSRGDHGWGARGEQIGGEQLAGLRRLRD